MSTQQYIRYRGAFVNQKQQVWRAEIWQNSDIPFTTIGDLTFDAESPVEIEWSEKDKHETVQGATCTVNVTSPSDRSFIDLYQVEPGNITLKLYLDDEFYWQGTLDCETYEEPYHATRDYTVTLTFTDFGCLGRLDFSEKGSRSIKWYIERIVALAGLPTDVIQYNYSLQAYCDNKWVGNDSLDKLYVESANFYDEDGEPNTLEEVLDGLLQPLALRIIQRNGKILVYDLNSLYTNYSSDADLIQWDGSEQTLSVDRLVRKASIQFSAYGRADLLSESDANMKITNWGDANKVGGYVGMPNSFNFYHTKDGKCDFDFQADECRAEFFKIQPITCADEAKGFAYLACLGNNKCKLKVSYLNNGDVLPYLPNVAPRQPETAAKGVLSNGFITLQGSCNKSRTQYLYRSQKMWCPASPKVDVSVDIGTSRGYYSKSVYQHYIHLKQELLLDSRINPFAEASDTKNNYNDDTNHKYNACREAAVYIPYSLVLFDVSGKAVYQYVSGLTGNSNIGGWHKIGYDDTNYFWHRPDFLVYHDNSDIWSYKDKPGVDGWTCNRDDLRFLNYTGSNQNKDSKYPEKFVSEGVLIPLPPESGYVQLTIYVGAVVIDNFVDGKDSTLFRVPSAEQLDSSYIQQNNLRHNAVSVNDDRFIEGFRWWLYKVPTMKVVVGTNARDASPDDTEITAWVNDRAAEDLSIDTICGTLTRDCPISRGIIRDANGNTVELKRTNTTAPFNIEYDLLGMMFSQYSSRHSTLAGEVVTPSSFKLYKDRAMSADTRFMIKSEVLSAIAGTSEVKFVELTPEAWSKNIIDSISVD